jgi:enoyl-CoA hydratase
VYLHFEPGNYRKSNKYPAPSEDNDKFGSGGQSDVHHSPTILVEVQNSFTPQMELLRREFSDMEWPNNTTEDEFDSRSIHVTISVDGELAGMVRLTKRPLSVLSAWAIGSHHVPNGKDVIEATRAVVARKWRGMDLYKVLMAEATLYCVQSGALVVVGGIEPAFPLRAFLTTIGFRDVGEPTRFHNPPNGAVWGQIIQQDSILAVPGANRVLSECAQKLASRGFTLCPVSRDYCTQVLVAHHKGVLTISLARPEKLNALSSEMVAALSELFQEAGRNSSVRVVLLCGLGRAFCVGADILELASDDRDAAADFVRRGAELVAMVADLGKPVVGSIDGYALGGGLELALGCTIRVASDRTMFGLPEVRLGIMPGWGGTQRLARLCGSSRAALMALTGEPIDAATAQAWGLVDRVVPHDTLAEVTAALCRQLAESRQVASASVMSALLAATDGQLADGLRREAELFHELFMRPDTQETIVEFLRSRRAKKLESYPKN